MDSLSDILTKSSEDIPEQKAVPWHTAFLVSWRSLKRRIGRSVITMVGVVLAIAFITYMFLTDNITTALLEVENDALRTLLQQQDVEIFTAGETDRMMILLILLSLITSLVGIINSMLMSVTERVREIGTLKCLGALDFFILQTYFIESSLMGVIGTLIGIVIGVLVAVVVALGGYGHYVVKHFPVLQVFGSVILAFVIGTLISVIASIAPAQWAAKKQPVEALRVEE